MDAAGASIDAEEDVTQQDARPAEDSANGAEKGENTEVKQLRVKKSAKDTTLPEAEKLKVLQEKYSAQKLELRTMEKELNLSKRREATLQRDRDLFQSDIKKGAAVREKLELLCRELQKQNKIIQEDSRRISEEEAMKRAELSTKFESYFKDIQVKLDGHMDERQRLIKENETLTGHLQTLVARSDLDKQYAGRMEETTVLQKKLFAAQLAEAAHGRAAEEAKAKVYKNELEGLAIREKALLRQIDSYSGKFGEVETLVQESKAMFAKSKADNDRLAKALRRAEAESGELRRKVLSSEAALLRLLDERRDGEAALKKARARGDKLEALCRTLQEERKGSGAAVGGGAQVGGGTAPETPPGKGDVQGLKEEDAGSVPAAVDAAAAAEAEGAVEGPAAVAPDAVVPA